MYQKLHRKFPPKSSFLVVDHQQMMICLAAPKQYLCGRDMGCSLKCSLACTILAYWHTGMVCTLTSPGISANSPKSEETSVVVIV